MRALDTAAAAWRLAPRLEEMDELSVKVGAHARALNGLPAGEPAGGTPVDRLRTASTLLERAVRERDESVVNATASPEPAAIETSRAEAAEAHAAPGEPNDAMLELIDVRDMLLVAAGGQDEPARATFELLDAKLGGVLSRMGVEPIEDSGPLDATRHEVVDVRPTTDAEQADRVCATVRPGYVIGGRVVRPQQVSVYRLSGDA